GAIRQTSASENRVPSLAPGIPASDAETAPAAPAPPSVRRSRGLDLAPPGAGKLLPSALPPGPFVRWRPAQKLAPSEPAHPSAGAAPAPSCQAASVPLPSA